MILHHVAQRACALVKPGATFNAQCFCRRDLHRVNVMRVPERRENRVRESHYQDVLCSFLAQEMVDAVGLLFGERVADHVIKFTR